MENQEIISFISPIDQNYMVVVVYPESENYSAIHKIMETLDNSIAFLVVEKHLIIFDGQKLEELNNHQFKAVQAHEICHSILEHKGEGGEDEEVEADLAAIDLLIRLGEQKAADALSTRLSDQRGIVYDEKSLKRNLSRRSFSLYRRYRQNLRKPV